MPYLVRYIHASCFISSALLLSSLLSTDWHRRAPVLHMFQFGDRFKRQALSKYGHSVNMASRTPVCAQLRLAYDKEPEPKAFTRPYPSPAWHAHIVQEKLGSNHSHILFFTDNPTKAKSHIDAIVNLVPDLSYELIDLDMPSSLFLMTQCDHHMLTASTFGFWGAYLSPHQDDAVPGRVFYSPGFVKVHLGNGLIPYPDRWELVKDI